MLGAFFDDSGTHAGSPFVVMAGVLGTSEQWDAFETAWRGILERPFPNKPPLKQFHCSPCRTGDGEFIDYSPAERDNLTHRFRRVIVDLGLLTVAQAVDKAAWDELVVGDIAEQVGDPLEYCLMQCVEKVIGAIRLRRPSEKVDLWFDEGTEKKLGAWRAVYRMHQALYPEIAGLRFAPVAKVIALQAADMVAYETYQYNQVWVKGRLRERVNPHFRDFLNQPELSSGFVLAREHIEELVRRVADSKAAVNRTTE